MTACFHLPSVTCENCVHLRTDQPYTTTGSRWYFTPSTNRSAPVPTIHAMAKRIMELEDAWSEQLRELERAKEVIAKLAEQRDHWCDMSRIRLAEADEMRECLRWYVKNDDTMRGGRWEEANEPWLAGKRRAMRALGIGEDE